VAINATTELDYDQYNREERYVCSHLFRLLHEPAGDYLALRRFLGDAADVDGKTRSMHMGCDHWEFRDGKVLKKDSYWKIVEGRPKRRRSRWK
jgi:hypothetical protein